MSDESSRAHVSELLEALQERAEQPSEPIRTRQASRIQQISDRVAARAASARPPHTLPSVLAELCQQTGQLAGGVRFHDVGTVQHIGNGVATLSGLPNARTDELVDFPTGVQGMILNLDHGFIDVMLLGTEEGIQGGDLVTATGQRLRVGVGKEEA